jgi:hypothetical protein
VDAIVPKETLTVALGLATPLTLNNSSPELEQGVSVGHMVHSSNHAHRRALASSQAAITSTLQAASCHFLLARLVRGMISCVCGFIHFQCQPIWGCNDVVVTVHLSF